MLFPGYIVSYLGLINLSELHCLQGGFVMICSHIFIGICRSKGRMLKALLFFKSNLGRSALPTFPVLRGSITAVATRPMAKTVSS